MHYLLWQMNKIGSAHSSAAADVFKSFGFTLYDTGPWFQVSESTDTSVTVSWSLF